MLVALVLTAEPTAPATVPSFLGRAAHAWLLDQVRRCEPQLAQSLHLPHRPRPFTVSPLWTDSSRPIGGRLHLSAGQTCHLRVTSVEAGLSHLLTDTLAPRWTDSTMALAGASFRVRAVATSPAHHPQAGQLSYLELSQAVESSPPPEGVTLRFLTPTTFRRSPPPPAPFGAVPSNVPLPLPELVFGGLASTWNAFAPRPLPEDLRAFAQDCVVVSRYDLRTVLVDFGGGTRGRVGGFVGTCRFAFRSPDPAWRRRIGLLAAFAPFAGVGWRTTMGLGQVGLIRAEESGRAE